jgi:C-terminal processing protease CtpA/Prc
MMQKISELTLAERDDYVCRQSIAVLQVSGYDMPSEVAMDYLLDSDVQDGYRFDVLDCVFNCISFALEHKRDDAEVKEAMENMLVQVGAEHVHRLTDRLFKIAESAAKGDLEPVAC